MTVTRQDSRAHKGAAQLRADAPTGEQLAEALAAARGAHDLVEELHVALNARTAEIELLRQANEQLAKELAALRRTKLFRYTSGLRALYGARRLAE